MKINTYKGIEDEWRTILGVKVKKPLIFIGVNPSIASLEEKDTTTKRIESYCKLYNHYGYYILNLYPQVNSNPSLLHLNPLQNYIDRNFNEIKNVFKENRNSDVIACWGTSIELRKYLFESLEEIINVSKEYDANWYSIGELLDSGHPRHPARASSKFPKTPFKIDNYIVNRYKIQNVDEAGISDFSPYNKNAYQIELTDKLDKGIKKLDQNSLNEIVLWKVNRYATIENHLYDKLNALDSITNRKELKELIVELLNQKGIGLPMASTILRFLNPIKYQIIDQRAYRVLYGKRLVMPLKATDQSILYLNYLDKLNQICRKYSIPFNKADRILYYLDKEINKNIKLSNY